MQTYWPDRAAAGYHEADGRAEGWDIYVQPADTNKTDETFAAAERMLGLS